ncbi:PLP-dependent aminotransferase family protein [Labrys sp. KNU-23]|uniref:aminotransferase-like domain-containing protein n=1 Tax=Labrys sp. KNU-23 TaxID=2789216 RepID=UPI001AEEA4E7|nr:PLP-dependent aminotransferase family protein [Labrys sp. KNU-23]
MAQGHGPPFERLAAALADDIAAGLIGAGDRLPAHRDLAWRLGIGIGTVTKAYARLEQRGLVRSLHGRGMFVAGSSAAAGTGIDLSVNAPPQMLSDRLLQATLSTLSKRLDAGTFGAYCHPAGRPEHRRLMARWLARGGVDARPDCLLLSHGAQHALAIAMATSCPPGTLLLTEALTYPGALLVARQAGLEPVGLAMDEEGLTPDALAEALGSDCGRHRVLYVTPTLHNPTTATMGAERRKALVHLCRTHDVTIIEDDVYGIFAPEGINPLASLAPERTFHVTGLSKALSPGLRMGALVVPPDHMAKAEARLQASSTTASALLAEIMEMWLVDGTAEAVAASVRADAARRSALAAERLPAQASLKVNGGFHAWLPMPADAAERFVARAALHGVALMPARAAMADPAALQGGVRISLGAPAIDQLARALGILADLFQPDRPVLV